MKYCNFWKCKNFDKQKSVLEKVQISGEVRISRKNSKAATYNKIAN